MDVLYGFLSMIIVFSVVTLIIFLICYYLLQEAIENGRRKSLYEFKKKNLMFFNFTLLKSFIILGVTSLIYV